MGHNGEQKTIEFVDGLFGPGMGERNCRFVDTIESETLREMVHGYHELQGDTRDLSVEENYLLGMTVLCATKSYGTACMFAKTLLHLGVPKAKLMEAVARLAMWVGGVPAVEAAIHIQRAINDYEARGVASMEAWFPTPPRAEGK